MANLVLLHKTILSRVEDLASFIIKLKKPEPAIVTLTSGGIVFAADLIRTLANRNVSAFPFEALAPDLNFSKQVHKKIGNHKRILVIDDIFDTGEQLKTAKLALADDYEVLLATLLVKKGSLPAQNLQWHGFTIPDVWVYGYGMDDSNGLNRGLLDIVTDENLPAGYVAP